MGIRPYSQLQVTAGGKARAVHCANSRAHIVYTTQQTQRGIFEYDSEQKFFSVLFYGNFKSFCNYFHFPSLRYRDDL